MSKYQLSGGENYFAVSVVHCAVLIDNHPNFAAFKCSNGYEHHECGPEMHAQCSSDLAEHTKAVTCVEGCFCPSGLVEHENTCIKKSQCPCQLNGKVYLPGQETNERCYKWYELT